MENLLFLGVPILKHIRVTWWFSVQDFASLCYKMHLNSVISIHNFEETPF